METWKPIPSQAGYEASSFGRIRSMDRVIEYVCSRRGRVRKRCKGRVIKPQYNRHGKQIAEINGLCMQLAPLVCEAFNGPSSESKPWCLHKDDVSDNNVPDNLYWGTAAQNAEDKKRNGNDPAGQWHGAATLTNKKAQMIRVRRAAGERGVDLAREFGVSADVVCDIHLGRTYRN